MEVCFNWIVWNICFYLAYTGFRKDPYHSCKVQSGIYKKLIFFMSLYALFTFFGGDIKRDKEFVEQGGYIAANLNLFNSMDDIYIIFAQYSFGQLVIWKALVYLPCIYFAIQTFKRLNRFNYSTLLFFILFFQVSIGSTRGVLGYSIYLYGLSLTVSRSNVTTLIGHIVIISTFFLHNQMLVPIMLYYLSYIPLNRKRIIVLLVSIPIIITFVNFILIPYLETDEMFRASRLGFKYQSYIENEDIEFLTSIPQKLYTTLTYIVVGLSFLWSLKAEIYKSIPIVYLRIIRICFYLIYIFLILSNIDILNIDVVAGRYFSMTTFFIFIIIPIIFENKLISKNKYNFLIKLAAFKVNLFFAWMLWNEIS